MSDNRGKLADYFGQIDIDLDLDTLRSRENVFMSLSDNSYTFKQTCSAFPESFDVFDASGEYAGYVRMRSDILRCYDKDDKLLFTSVTDSYGCFDDDKERAFWLNACALALSGTEISHRTLIEHKLSQSDNLAVNIENVQQPFG